MITRRVEENDLWIAELGGTPAGALVTCDAPPDYVEPVTEPELYVGLLLTSRRHAGQEIGARLLAHARTLVVERA